MVTVKDYLTDFGFAFFRPSPIFQHIHQVSKRRTKNGETSRVENFHLIKFLYGRMLNDWSCYFYLLTDMNR